MSMADSTCTIKFGPEWIRVLSDAGGTSGNNLQSQSAGGGSGGSQNSGSLSSLNSIPSHLGPPRKYPLAQYRYGKEEMIAIYEQSLYGDFSPPVVMPPGGNGPNGIDGVWSDRSQTPRSLLPMTDEEQRAWTVYRLTHSSTGRGRGRGLGPMGGSGSGSSSSSTLSGGWSASGNGSQPVMRSWRSTGGAGGGNSGSQQHNERGGTIRDRAASGTTTASGQSVHSGGASGPGGGAASGGLWRRNSQPSQSQPRNSPPQHQQPVNNNRNPQPMAANNNNTGVNNNSSDTMNNGNISNNNNASSNSHHNHDSDDNKVPEWADDTLTGTDGGDATDNVGSFDERGGFLGGPPVHDRSPLLNSASSGSVRSVQHPNITANTNRQPPQQLQRSLSNVEVTGTRTYTRELSLGDCYSQEIEPFGRKVTASSDVNIPSDRVLSSETPVTSSASNHPSALQHSPQTVDDNGQSTLTTMVSRGHCISDRDSPVIPAGVGGTPSAGHWPAHCVPISQPQPGPPRVDPVQMSSPVIGNVVQPNCANTMLCGTTPANPAAVAGSACDLWYYKDPQGLIQGPFSSADMLDWCRQGYFHDGLECRRVCDNVFSPLGLLKKAWNGHIPFVAPSMVGPINNQFAPPIGTPVHSSTQHLHSGSVSPAANSSVFGPPMGGAAGGAMGLLPGVPNPAHVLLSHNLIRPNLSPRSVPTADQHIVASNGIISQAQASPHVDTQLHHHGPSQLQKLFGSVGSSDVVSLDGRQHAGMLGATAVSLPGGLPSQLSTHGQSSSPAEQLLPMSSTVDAGNSHSPLVSSPSRSVASGVMISPVQEPIQQNIHESISDSHDPLITAPTNSVLPSGTADVRDGAVPSIPSPVTSISNGISFNGSTLPEELLLTSTTPVSSAPWYSTDSPAQPSQARDSPSPVNAQLNEDIQLQRLHAASDAVRRQVEENNEKNIVGSHLPAPARTEQSSPSVDRQVAPTAAATSETKKESSTVSSPAVATSGTTPSGNKKKKERRDKKATAAAAAAANDKDKAEGQGGSASSKNNKNRAGGDHNSQRNTASTKENKKQQQQQQQQQQQTKEQQDSTSDWNDDYRVEDHDRDHELIVPAPAPAVPAWGARSEWTNEKSAPSLGEIQRAEEERAQRERAQRQREAARSGCTTAGARTWASAIAPTKSFEQIQKEEASKVTPNHISTVKSPQANRTAQPALMSAAVANGIVSPQQNRLGVSGQQTPVKSAPVSPLAPTTKIAPLTTTKTPPIAEVATNEQQLIDWCTQITMGLNSKTYLDIPTVVSILKDVESEAEIEDYVSQFFGESLKEPRQFARQFVQKRARLGVGAASAQPRQPGWCTNSKKHRSNGTHSNNKANSKKV